jgi:hypothetical protein
LPLDRAAIGRFLMYPGMKAAFDRAAYGNLRVEHAEGKGCAASGNG